MLAGGQVPQAQASAQAAGLRESDASGRGVFVGHGGLGSVGTGCGQADGHVRIGAGRVGLNPDLGTEHGQRGVGVVDVGQAVLNIARAGLGASHGIKDAGVTRCAGLDTADGQGRVGIGGTAREAVVDVGGGDGHGGCSLINGDWVTY